MMIEPYQSGKLTKRDRRIANLWRWAPWLSFFPVALPAPLIFLVLYFMSNADAAVWMLLALSSLALGSLVGLFVVVALLFFRQRWLKNLRGRLAADGITADELSWFQSELTGGERRALKQLEQRNLLLADAYRETLAARITATRVISSTRREASTVEKRLRQTAALRGTGRADLEQDLRSDRERLKRILREANDHRAEAETRLRLIEATASRNTSEAETQLALRRLGAMREQVPLALESFRAEREAREHIEQELRRESDQLSPDS